MAIRHNRAVQKTAGVNSLVDNTTGLVSDTLVAIPNSNGILILDLINDLNTDVLPAIRNDIASLAAKVNTIIVALRKNGFL